MLEDSINKELTYLYMMSVLSDMACVTVSPSRVADTVHAPAVLRAPLKIPDPAQPTKYSNSSPSPRNPASSRKLSFLGEIAFKLFTHIYMFCWCGVGGGLESRYCLCVFDNVTKLFQVTSFI